MWCFPPTAAFPTTQRNYFLIKNKNLVVVGAGESEEKAKQVNRGLGWCRFIAGGEAADIWE
jgi:hypothetical protein